MEVYLCVKRWKRLDELGILGPFFRGLVWNGKAPYDIPEDIPYTIKRDCKLRAKYWISPSTF